MLLCGSWSCAQVVPANQVLDPGLRAMQQGAMPGLTLVGQNIKAHRFDHDFYCTRKLDIDEGKQKRSDQHSIRFEQFQGETVLAISGNYYGAYAAGRFNQEERARRTFFSVVVPLAKASVPVFATNESVQGFAFEVSHHVIGTLMGDSIERAENMMVYLPRTAAIKLISAKDREAQQAALLEGEVFVNASPLQLWLSDEGRPSRVETENSRPVTLTQASTAAIVANHVNTQELPDTPMPRAANATVWPNLAPVDPVVKAPAAVAAVQPTPPPASLRDTPSALVTIQTADQAINDRLVRELGKEAHFTAVAPPTFVPFHKGIYLDLSLNTRVNGSSGSSRYKMAALAFDDHISPIIRHVLLYFQNHEEFDGIDFSTSVSTGPKATPSTKTVSVEFFFSLGALRSYEAYDVTGQQLLDGGIVLINGERVQLDLQQAESGGRP